MKVHVCCAESGKAEHIIIEAGHLSKLHRLHGSKYMQSNFADVMRRICAAKCKRKILVFGTPCQIAGNNVILIDLICHGVPTYGLYKKYREYA